jgi:hypothetical protein
MLVEVMAKVVMQSLVEDAVVKKPSSERNSGGCVGG